MCRTLCRGLWNLELHLQRSQLADPEAFVAFGDLLSFSDVANHDGTGKRCAQARLVELDLQAMDFRLAAFGHGLPTMHVVFGAPGFEFSLFEFCLAGKPQVTELLLARERRSLGLQLGLP